MFTPKPGINQQLQDPGSSREGPQCACACICHWASASAGHQELCSPAACLSPTCSDKKATRRFRSVSARATEQAFVCRIPRSLDDVQFQAVCTIPMGDTRGKRSENKSKTGGWPWKYIFLCKTVYSRRERARYNSLSCHRDQTPFSLCLVMASTARHKTFCRKVLPAKMLKCFYFRQKNKAFEDPEKKPLSDQTSQHPLEKGLGSLSPAPIS